MKLNFHSSIKVYSYVYLWHIETIIICFYNTHKKLRHATLIHVIHYNRIKYFMQSLTLLKKYMYIFYFFSFNYAFVWRGVYFNVMNYFYSTHSYNSYKCIYAPVVLLIVI